MALMMRSVSDSTRRVYQLKLVKCCKLSFVKGSVSYLFCLPVFFTSPLWNFVLLHSTLLRKIAREPSGLKFMSIKLRDLEKYLQLIDRKKGRKSINLIGKFVQSIIGNILTSDQSIIAIVFYMPINFCNQLIGNYFN